MDDTVLSLQPSSSTTSASAGSLPAHLAPARRICIVTNEFNGLHKNGGIGTANTGLALALAEGGFKVTVLYCNPPEISEAELARLRRSYGRKGVELEFIGQIPALRRPFDSPGSVSYAVFLFVRERRYDVIYFHDNCGRGYYSLLAKHTGCFPNAPLMLVVAHGPHEWVYELNSSPYRNKEPVIYAFLERRSVELADILISPSRYLIEWLVAHGWTLPTKVFVEQNIVPVPQAASSRQVDSPGEPHKIREIVFFGRIEPRKGILLFCDAIDLLSKRLDLSNTQITFLGKFDRIDGLHSGTFVVERSRKWPAPVRILATKGQQEALEYLRGEGVLAVIPSLAENSPCVVLECLQLGIPFVATGSGGTPELVEGEAWERCLCRPEERLLAEHLESALLDGHAPAALAVPQRTTIERWLRFHACSSVDEDADRAVSPPGGDAPLVSICLVDPVQECAAGYNLESILTQNYPNLEILIGDRSDNDGSVGAIGQEIRVDTARRIQIRRLRQLGLSLAAARNAIARKATGRYLLFIDTPDVILLPGSVGLLVEAAEKTGARLVSAFGLQLPADIRPVPGRDGEIARFPIGPSLEVGAVENCFGECLTLVERCSFEHCGGFPLGEDGVVGFWQFFVSAHTAGVPVELVPQAAYWYRQRPSAALSRSLAVVNTRATLDLLGGMELSTVRHLLETYVDVAGEQQSRLQGHLVNLRHCARELATRLSWHDPNSPAALEIFVEYQLESGRSREALDFVFDNNLESGSHVCWFNRTMAFEFEWDSPAGWHVELRLAQKMTPEHARQVTAHLDDVSVPIAVREGESGRTLLLVTGPASQRTATALKLTIGIPAVHRVTDASYELGYSVAAVTIGKADSAAGQHNCAAAMNGTPKELAAASLPAAGADQPGEPQSDGYGCVRLDEFCRVVGYQHLDISVLPVRVGSYRWPHLKFKFCLTPDRAYLEFREAPDWPVIFVAFPGEETDAYGAVFRASAVTIAGLLPIRFDRDNALFAAIATHLPDFVRQAVRQAELTAAEVEELVATSERTAEELVRTLQGGAIEASALASAT